MSETKQYIKFHKLTTPLAIPKKHYTDDSNQKIHELEEQLANYIEENKNLEESIRKLKNHQLSSPESLRIVESEQIEPKDQTAKTLVELLNTIDSKYSFDTLNSIQLGDNTSLTMKNFLKHFFYSLRKKGLVSYPENTVFTVNYNDSGLYNCQNFQILKNDTKQVRVLQKGWAVKTQNNLYPIRKAILELDE